MNRKLLGLCLGAAFAGLAGQAIAAPFVTFDPRSMAMGGTGVAVTDFNNAPFFNPALMAHAGEDDDFNLAFPVVGGRFFDQDELIDVIDEDAENTIDRFERAADETLNAPAFNTGTVTVPSSAQLLSAESAVEALDDLLSSVDAKALQIELGAAAVVGIPSKRFGMGLSLLGWTATGGIADYAQSDQALLQSIIADTAAAAVIVAALETGDASQLPPGFNPARPCATLTGGNVNDLCQVDFDQDRDVQSEVRARGIAVAELGLTIAREFQLGSAPLAVGVTPKLVTVSTFDFVGNINTADTDDFSDSTNEESNFNLDIGVAHQYGNGWQVGVVIKNLISQEYEAPPQNGQAPFTVELEPQARAGVAYQNDWLLAAADLDLTENGSVGFGDDSRFLSLGLELDALDWAQLRFGLRNDLANDARDATYSIGAGLSPFGSVHFDIAFTADDFSDPTEVGAALQLAFTF